jgi:hypothetical protein
VCSAALLSVAIPNGVDRFSSDDSIPGTTVVRSPMATKVKNATAAVGEVHDDQSVRALAVGDTDLVIAPSDTVSADGTIPITTKDGEIIQCHVLARDESTGLAILNIPTGDDVPSFRINGIADRDATDDFDIDDLRIIEPITGIAVSSQLSISSQTIDLATAGAVPLDVDIRINGIAVVVNTNNKVVGVAFTRNHASWMLPMKVVRKLINDARAVRDALLQPLTQ